MIEAFWAGRRVFLTGHTGFKGSWLSLWLQRAGARVSGYALDPPTSPNLFELARVVEGMESTHGDIRDGERLRATMSEASPQTVFHLAAQPLVRDAFADPVETYDVNVMGTLQVLEAMRRVEGIESAVIVTTDKCYENRDTGEEYREGDHLGGDDPYSSSKACVELLTASYRTSFFRDPQTARIATARAGNVIGGGDYARDRLLPDLLAAAKRGEPARIRNPHAVRPWQHVLDPLCGYLLLAQALSEQGAEVAEAWNFGPAAEDARPVSWLADYVTRAWGEGAAWETDRRSHPRETDFLRLDASKARARLQWRPRLDLAAALDWTIDWSRACMRGDDVRARCISDIQRYTQLASGDR